MSRLGSSNFGAFGSLGGASSSASGKGSLASLNSKPKDATSTKNAPKIDANDYVPKRFGLKYSPPTIIVEYLVPSSGKLYHHKFKISNLKADSDTWDTLDALKKKHHQYFSGNKVADNQITDLIDKLKKKLKESVPSGTFLTSGGFGENKSDTGSKLGKLASLGSSLPGKQANNLASLDANKSKGGLGSLNSKTASNDKKKDDKKDGNNFWAFDDLEDLDDEEDEEKIDYNATNLNKLSKEELQKHKNKMDVLFNKNNKKPGDPGFEYDKQEEFVPKDDNEWDDEF